MKTPISHSVQNQLRHPQFPQDQSLIYLNHAAVAPWPQCTADAVKQFAEENLHFGARDYPLWMQKEQELREALAWLVNAASADDIALLKNTSEGLSVIAYGLDWHAGDNVVIPLGEFPSNRIVWESLQQFGVELRQIDIRNATDAEQALLDAMDERTRVISVSAVQYADGFRLDLQKIGTFCAQTETLFVVDAIQQLGALKFDAQACKADFVVADGHKWMLGPEGLALFYSNPASRDQLRVQEYGWHMIENPGDFSQKNWQIARSARRFEPGSPNMLGIVATLASLQLIRDTGLETIQQAILMNVAKVIDYIEKSPQYELLSDPSEPRRSGIVTFRHQQQESQVLYKSLMENSYVCAERGGGIRFSPHFYHQDWEFGQVFEFLSRF